MDVVLCSPAALGDGPNLQSLGAERWHDSGLHGDGPCRLIGDIAWDPRPQICRVKRAVVSIEKARGRCSIWVMTPTIREVVSASLNHWTADACADARSWRRLTGGP